MTEHSAKTIYCISDGYVSHWAFSDPDERDSYLSDIKKRFPLSTFEPVEMDAEQLKDMEFNLGRPASDQSLIWGGSGVWDFITSRVLNFSNTWVWSPGEIEMEFIKPKLCHTISRFWPLRCSIGQKVMFEKVAKRGLGHIKVEPIDTIGNCKVVGGVTG